MDDKTKYEIVSRVMRDIEPRDIAEELHVPYASVLRVRTQYKESVANGTIDKMFDMDKLMIEELAEKFPVDDVNALVKKVDGLERLSEELQGTATLINSKVRTLLHSIDSASELTELTDIICKLQNAFLNKNSTQVNVQNNNFGDSNGNPYSQYLGDAPGTINHGA